MAKGNVTISIKKETQDKLKELKIIDEESYDGVINRLLLKNTDIILKGDQN